MNSSHEHRANLPCQRASAGYTVMPAVELGCYLRWSSTPAHLRQAPGLLEKGVKSPTAAAQVTVEVQV